MGRPAVPAPHAAMYSPLSMPVRSHSFIIFLTAVFLIAAFCLFTFWQRRQKEKETARQYVEFAAWGSRPARSTPEQQRALLEILSRNTSGSDSSRDVPCVSFTLPTPEGETCVSVPETFRLFPDGRFTVTPDASSANAAP